MNRDRIASELAPAMATWMHQHADTDLWDQVGRTVAVALGQRLLAGDPGSNPLLLTVHQTAASPAVRHVASALGGGRPWSINRVGKAVTAYLELYSGRYEVQRRLGREQTAQTNSLAA